MTLFFLASNESWEDIPIFQPIEPVVPHTRKSKRNIQHAKPAVHIQYSLFGCQPLLVQKLVCSEGVKYGVQAFCPIDLQVCVIWAQLSPGNVQFKPRITCVQRYLSMVCVSFTVGT